jgi:hypothetical protein
MEKMMREEGANSPIWKQVREIVDEKEVLYRFKVRIRLFRT